MRHLARFALVGLFTIAACGGDSGSSTSPKTQNVTGTWTGSSAGINVSAVLSQNGTAVTGTGQISSASGSFALTIDGTFVFPTLSASIESSGNSPANYTATLNGTQLVGVLNGSGFTNFGLTMSKQ